MSTFKKGRLIAFAVAALALGTAAAIDVNSRPINQEPFSAASPPEQPKITDRVVQEGGSSDPLSARMQIVMLCDCFTGYAGLTQEIADRPRAEHLGVAGQLFGWRTYPSPDVPMTPVVFGNPVADSTIKSDYGLASDPARIGSLY